MRTLVFLLCFKLAVAFAAEPAGKSAQHPAGAESFSRREPALLVPGASSTNALAALDDLILLERRSRSLPQVEAVPDEAAISRFTAKVLAQVHYLRQPLNDEISSKFLDRYLETLDGLHMHFLQSDLEEFDQYRTVLDDLTIAGKTVPAREIFKQYLQRIEQRVTYVAELLKSENFEFTGNDRYDLDRRKSAYPKDLDEARRLWRQHLRYEYLQEKLNLERPRLDGSARPRARVAKGQTNAVPASMHDEIVRTLSRRYARILRFWRDEDGGDVLQFYLTALMHVYDPHSDYLGKSTLDNFAMSSISFSVRVISVWRFLSTLRPVF